MGYKKRSPSGQPDYEGRNTTNNTETIQEEPEAPAPAPEPVSISVSDEERKQIIANKRRETLAKARAMRTPKHEIRKQAQETIQNKDELIKTKDEIIKTKEQELGQTKQDIENNRIKMLEDNIIMMKKLISDRPQHPQPIEVPPAKPKRVYKPKEPKQPQPQQPPPQQQPPQQQPPTTNALIDKSYREQLQERLRTQVLNKIMMETFS
jgi:hypothetical protein